MEPYTTIFSDESTPQWLLDATPEEMQRVFKALYRVHGLLGVLTDMDALLERISEEGCLLACAEGASVMLYDEAKEELYFKVVVGETDVKETLKREVRLKLGQGIAGTAALEGRTIHVEDVSKDHRFFHGADDASQFCTHDILALPMYERGKLVGVLELVNKVGEESFSPLDRHVMEMFSSLAAAALVGARKIEHEIQTERLAAIGHAIAGLTHHIKNILSGMIGSAELIDLAFEANDLSLVKRTWSTLNRSVKRITNFVQDLLLVAKPNTPYLQACPVLPVVMDACESMQDLARPKGINFKLNYDNPELTVKADPDALLRCIINLIGNALDAVPEQTGRIELTIGNHPSKYVEITVKDNGSGIPVELRDHIFDMFFTTKGTRGTGLGLACSAKIAREHGGSLNLLESSEGVCIQLLLPAMESKTV